MVTFVNKIVSGIATNTKPDGFGTSLWMAVQTAYALPILQFRQRWEFPIFGSRSVGPQAIMSDFNHGITNGMEEALKPCVGLVKKCSTHDWRAIVKRAPAKIPNSNQDTIDVLFTDLQFLQHVPPIVKDLLWTEADDGTKADGAAYRLLYIQEVGGKAPRSSRCLLREPLLAGPALPLYSCLVGTYV